MPWNAAINFMSQFFDGFLYFLWGFISSFSLSSASKIRARCQDSSCPNESSRLRLDKEPVKIYCPKLRNPVHDERIFSSCTCVRWLAELPGAARTDSRCPKWLVELNWFSSLRVIRWRERASLKFAENALKCNQQLYESICWWFYLFFVKFHKFVFIIAGVKN